jgi:hypothetical protein
MPLPISTISRETAKNGGAEFLCRLAHDDAQCRAEVSETLRAAATGANASLRFASATAAPLDSFEISAAPFYDAELHGLGTPFRRDSCSLEQCRSAVI